MEDHSTPTERDIRSIGFQLKKRNPSIPEKILLRCSFGFPVVVLANCIKINQKKHKRNKKRRKKKKRSTPLPPQKRMREKNEEVDDDDEKNGESEIPEAKRVKMVIVPGTLFWLTCPRISEYIDHLESTGFIGEIKRKYIKEKSDILNKTHDRFREFIKSNVSHEKFLKWITANRVKVTVGIDENMIEVKRYGNAGEEFPNSVKCLHAHFAPFLLGVKDEIASDTFKEIINRNNIICDIEDIGGTGALKILECKENCVRCEQIEKRKICNDNQDLEI